MSHFYGSLEGLDLSAVPGRGVGSEEGLETILRSGEGALAVQVYEGEGSDGGLEDRVTITFKKVMSWPPEVPPQFVGQEFTLYDGPISECCFSCIFTNTQEVES